MMTWSLFVLFAFLLSDLTKRGSTTENLQQAFRVEPDDVTVHEGEMAVLRCEVDNLSGVVQWAKDGLLLGPSMDIPSFPRYRMVGDSSEGKFDLQVTRSQLEDDAIYACQVGPSESSGGLISRSALLTVLVPPKRPLIVEYAAGSVVTWVAGTEYTLNCLVEDARPPADIAFYHGDVAVTDVDSSVEPGSSEKVFSTKATLRITPQSSYNKQQLTCRASNPVALIPVVVGFTMNILFPPQPPIIQGYKSPVVKGKDKLKLTCISLSGNPLATLQWLKNDEVISRNWETDEASQLSRSFLSINPTAEDNLAVVTCQALNQVLPLPLQATVMIHVAFLPEQVKIIGSTSAPENKEISVSCSASPSNPPVLLRWWLGWKELNATEVIFSEAAHGGMITVSNLTYIVQREDNGLSLICEAFNEATMSAKSATVTLRVEYPPEKIWIDVPPPGAIFRYDTEVKLVCFASGGSPLPRLNWFKENRIVTQGTTSGSSGNIVSKELILKTAPSDNMATYRCNATGSSRLSALTAFTRLHVQFPPLHVTITVKEKNIKSGQSVTLHCKSGSSNPPASLTWIKDGKKLQATNLGQTKAEFGGFSAMGKMTLVVSSADHGTRIECHAYSTVLSEDVNTFYQLTVLFPPEFSTQQTHRVQVMEHGATQLPLLVSASPPEITYRWRFLGEVLLTEGSPRYHLREGGSLEIWNVTRADAGIYRISCENSEGQNETTVVLDVQYSPTIRSIGDPTYVDLGCTAEIVCQADANPITTNMFQWKWLGDLEKDLGEMGVELLSEGLVGRLRVLEAQRSHAGLFECQVDNEILPVARSTARLIVRYPPEIIKGPGLRKMAVSGDGRSQAALQCHAQGVPSVQFTWAKNGDTLDLQDPRYSVVTEYEGSLYVSSLTIVNVSAVLDYATFTCTASNELGTDLLDIQLLSTSHPDPPSGLKVVSVAHNWVTLQWTPGFDGGLQQSFRIRYHWPEAVSFQYVDVVPPHASLFTLTGLLPHTVYNVSVNARNALGESDYADGGVGLRVSTAEKEGKPDFTEPKIPSMPEQETPVMSLALGGVLGGFGGLLIVSNLSFLACLLHRRKSRTLKEHGTQETTKGKVRFGNSYTVAKWLKLGPHSEEGGSEDSSPKTTSAGSTATAQGWSQPGRHAESETDASVTEPNIPLAWFGSPGNHEYEEVRLPRKYEEVGPLYNVWNAKEEPWIHEYAGAYQHSGQSSAGYVMTLADYDPVADLWPLDEEVPFEQQGELV
uniref:NPHS1 adhesion molecule, nephrin n=1 Tax=Salvator merianae TaxID=96440 RepID=A0A8D0BBY2_SALMN